MDNNRNIQVTANGDGHISQRSRSKLKSEDDMPSHENAGGDTNNLGNGKSHAGSESYPHPFIYKLYPTRLERITWYLMAFTLAPIKLAFVIVFLTLAWIMSCIAVWGWPLLPDKPLSGWRIHFRDAAVFLVRCAWFSAGVISQTIKGKQASSKEAPVIIMGPHSSFVDTLAGASCGFPGVVSVIENARLPFIGTLFRVNQSVFVERGDPDSRRKAAQEIRRRAETKGAWPSLVIFPEGMCCTSTCLLPYKVGAFLAGVSVQPVTIKYNNRLDTTTWVNTGPGLFALFTLLLCTPCVRFEMEFHPVYHPSAEEKKDPELFARNIRNLMSRHLNLPKTDIGYSDLMELVKRSKPDRSVVNLWRTIVTKGYVEMPSKEHFS